jgi:hypothetical protein
MPKPINNDPDTLDGNALPTELETVRVPTNNSFMFHFQAFSPDLYAFRGEDGGHELLCEMTLELKETFVSFEEEEEGEGYLAPVVTCHFPSISVQKFNAKVGFDAYLQGVVMFQFQLKILEQLLLFCEEKDAATLALTINDTNLDYLDIYSRFIVSARKVATARGEQTEIVIPADVETYDEVVDFMDEVEKKFRKTLWREQTSNLVFREYLKGYALPFI